MIEGNVKWFDVKKGFGFIVGPDGQDVFVHFSSIEGDGFRTLKDGEPVTYELCHGDKGDFAKNVVRAVKKDLTADGTYDGVSAAGNNPEATLGRQQKHHQAVESRLSRGGF